jgi:FixJ family two-component response regulator
MQGEREITIQVVRSLLNKQIAGEIGITETTGKLRRRKLMPEINAASFA